MVFYTKNINDIFMIKYENGEELFNKKQANKKRKVLRNIL